MSETDNAALAVAQVFQIADSEWSDRLVELLRDADMDSVGSRSGHAFVIHQPNAPSGGRLSHIEREGVGPEQQALLRLIGTLVDVPPYADRSPA